MDLTRCIAKITIRPNHTIFDFLSSHFGIGFFIGESVCNVCISFHSFLPITGSVQYTFTKCYAIYHIHGHRLIVVVGCFRWIDFFLSHTTLLMDAFMLQRLQPEHELIIYSKKGGIAKRNEHNEPQLTIAL